MATETTVTLPNPAGREFLEKTLIKRLLPHLPMHRDAQKGTVPTGEGKIINWRKFNSIGLATTPLTEGVTPAGNNMSITTITATLAQYGDFIAYSDWLGLISFDAVLTQMAEVLAEQAGRTLHTVMLNELVSGTQVQYADGVAGRSSVASTNKADSAEFIKIWRTLRRNNVPPFPDGYYHALVHPDTVHDMMTESGSPFVDIAKYNGAKAPDGSMNLVAGEVGRMYGIRFIESTDAPVFVGAGSGGANVYATLVYGPDAYGVRDLAGPNQRVPAINPETNKGISLIFNELGSAGSSDPLKQRGTVGWKASFLCKIIDQPRIVRLEHGVTA